MFFSFQPVLLLDRNYIADRVISAKKAFDLVIVRQNAEIIQEYTDNKALFKPSVVRLISRSLIGIQRRRSKFHKGNLLARDQYTCQYCGKYSKYGLTIDHVIPRCRGGETSYENCVACCFMCNQKKGNFLPDEAGLILKTKPYAPAIETIPLRQYAPEEWLNFLK